MANGAHKAIFLDRDGVINRAIAPIKSIAEFRLLPGAASAIKAFNKKGYRVVVVTNQGTVAKGISKPEEIEEINETMRVRLAKQGAVLDAIYYCPHHPEGKLKEYAIQCKCRKPGTGMIEQAERDHGIDLAKSFLVGDKTGDILAGKRAGMRTILVKTGYGGSDKLFEVTPDFVAKNLAATVRFV